MKKEEEEVVGTTRVVVHILTQQFLLRMYLSSVVFGVLNKRAATRVFRRPWNLGDGPCARVWERQNLFYSSDNCLLLFYRDGDCSSHPTRSESGAWAPLYLAWRLTLFELRFLFACARRRKARNTELSLNPSCRVCPTDVQPRHSRSECMRQLQNTPSESTSYWAKNSLMLYSTRLENIRLARYLSRIRPRRTVYKKNSSESSIQV